MNDLTRSHRIAEIRSRRGSPERAAAIARLSAHDRDALVYVTTELHPSAKHVEMLRDELAAGCRDAAADFGEEIVEAGGYADIAASVIAMHPECTPATIREFKRIEGI